MFKSYGLDWDRRAEGSLFHQRHASKILDNAVAFLRNSTSPFVLHWSPYDGCSFPWILLTFLLRSILCSTLPLFFRIADRICLASEHLQQFTDVDGSRFVHVHVPITNFTQKNVSFKPVTARRTKQVVYPFQQWIDVVIMRKREEVKKLIWAEQDVCICPNSSLSAIVHIFVAWKRAKNDIRLDSKLNQDARPEFDEERIEIKYLRSLYSLSIIFSVANPWQ